MFDAFQDLQRRALEVVANGLEASAQRLRQERFRDRIEGKAVFWTGETVSFIRIQNVGHRNTALFQGRDDLIGFRLLYARVIGALAD